MTGIAKRHSYFFYPFLLFWLFFGLAVPTQAKEEKLVQSEIKLSQKTSQAVSQEDWETANKTFSPIKKWWVENKQVVKKKSRTLAQQIDLAIAQTAVALLNEQQTVSEKHLSTLTTALTSYQTGDYVDNQGNTQLNLTIYINKLKRAQILGKEGDWSQLSALVDELNTQWLSVEGDVVSKSQEVYDRTERDLLLLQASISDKNKERVSQLLSEMIQDLHSVNSSSYSLFDVAMIPFREGLEALLVIMMLLSVTRNAKGNEGKKWIAAGSIAGILTSIGLGLIVAFVFSVGAFGTNNNLINGYAGVFSSLMLLYVGLWLHKASDVKKMTDYYSQKTNRAMKSGNYLSLALLAFLAIVREGLEIVVFTIGLAGRLSFHKIVLGFGLGIFLLALVALFLIIFERRVPLKAFFLFSSAVIFYLALKFMGSGIHSLQLANVLPNTMQDYLPSFNMLSIYPSWYSLLPQIGFVLITLWVVLRKNRKKSEEK